MTTTDLLKWVVVADQAFDGSELQALLSALERVAGSHALDTVRIHFCEQVLRALEVALLADADILDIALNPQLYLGRERDKLSNRLADLLEEDPPETLVTYLRELVMSGAAGSSQKASVRQFLREVFRSYSLVRTELRCMDCGYHFVESDMGEFRRALAAEFRLELATVKLARRLRDPWKLASQSALTIDHIVPEAGFGPTTAANLQITCKFCNSQKQIYRWPGESGGRNVAGALLVLGDLSRGSWAAGSITYNAIRDAGGRCLACGRDRDAAEITARPIGRPGASVPVPWEVEAVCYDCYDPGN
jgi:hypothetical protein